jgi:hypothetical protein
MAPPKRGLPAPHISSRDYWLMAFASAGSTSFHIDVGPAASAMCT